MKYLVFGTPKAIAHVDQEKISEKFRKELNLDDKTVFEFIGTIDVYVNMLCGWSEEECDNHLYCIDEQSMKANCPTLEFKDARSLH